jgi:hypothetical protein
MCHREIFHRLNDRLESSGEGMAEETLWSCHQFALGQSDEEW